MEKTKFTTSELNDRVTFSVDELATVLHISRPLAYQLAHSENFPCIRVGKRMLVLADAFRTWLSAQAESREA